MSNPRLRVSDALFHLICLIIGFPDAKAGLGERLCHLPKFNQLRNGSRKWKPCFPDSRAPILNRYTQLILRMWSQRNRYILHQSAVFSSLLQGSEKSVVPRAPLASPDASPSFFNLGPSFPYLQNENNCIYTTYLSGLCVCACVHIKPDTGCKSVLWNAKCSHVWIIIIMTTSDPEYASLNKLSLSLE